MKPKYENQFIGELYIMNHLEKGYYLCKCKCGITFRTRIDNVRAGRTKTCPACSSRKLDNHQAAKNSLFRSYRKRASERNPVSFDLRMCELIEFAEKNCFYCGIKPSQTLNKWPDYFYNGVDRIDNAQGYYIGNCVSACKICNFSKNTNNLEEWVEWIKRAYARVTSPEYEIELAEVRTISSSSVNNLNA